MAGNRDGQQMDRQENKMREIVKKCPCVAECKNRTAECKKTCEPFLEYDRARLARSRARESDIEGDFEAHTYRRNRKRP